MRRRRSGRSTDPGVSAATIPWPAGVPAVLPAGDSSSPNRGLPAHGSSARPGEGAMPGLRKPAPGRPSATWRSRSPSHSRIDPSLSSWLLGFPTAPAVADATTTTHTRRPAPCRSPGLALQSPGLTTRIVASAPCSPGRSGRRSALACTRPAGKRPRPARPTAAAAGPAAPPAAGSRRIPRRGRRAGSSPPRWRSRPGAVRVESRLLGRPRPTLALVGRGLLQVLPALGIGVGRLI